MHLGFETLIEKERGFHPLYGICAGLEQLKTGERAVFCPCDLPWIDEESLERLMSADRLAVARSSARVQPLLCLLDSSVLPRALSIAAEGGRAMSLSDGLLQVLVRERVLFNLNIPLST